MEHNDKFSKRQKLRQILALHNQKGNNTHPSTNDSKICIASIPLKRKVTGIPQILATFWRVCVKLSRSVSFSRLYAHYLPKSVAYSEVTTLRGQPAKKLQTQIAVPANHRKRVHSCRQQRWPFATSLQIALLVKSLNQGELTMRAEAARRLGELGECAPVEPLLEALDDEQRFVRAEAARALGKLGERVPIAPLVTALHDRDGSVRVAAAQALGMLGKRESLEDLLQALNDSWPPVREATVLALGQFGEQVPLETFLASLQDEDKFVRAAALSVLGTLGKHTPIEPLVAALGDVQKRVREAAIQALISVREHVPIEALAAALKNRKWPPMREAAARVLSMLGERVPLELLEFASYDEWPPVRAVAELALLQRSPLTEPTRANDAVPETGSLDSKQHSVETVTAATTDSRHKPRVKSALSRLVVWQSTQFAQVPMPDWVRKTTIALIIACSIICTLFTFFQRKRISSIFMDNTSRIFRLLRTNAFWQKGA